MNFLLSKSTTLSNSIIQSLGNTMVASSLTELPSSYRCLIGTHDGSFHCDEALAIGMLKILPRFSASDAFVVRTRNPEILQRCDIVVDVGAVYDPNLNRFDHHQREFTGVLDGFKTKLSSAGLIYKHFGKEIIKCLLTDLPISEDFVDLCYPKVYKGFVEHIDAIDNGIAVADGELRYIISSTLSSRVGHLNPAWNEPQSAAVLNERFRAAMSLAAKEFVDHVLSLATVWWPGREIVKKAIENRGAVHPSGKILILDTFCPWREHLSDLEKDQNIEGQLLYVIYADIGGSWRLQAVPVASESFESRKKLPAEWCGLRDEELSAKLSLPGCIFVHASGFIGGHKDKEGALAMAVKALST